MYFSILFANQDGFIVSSSSNNSTTIQQTGDGGTQRKTPAVGHPAILKAYEEVHLDPAEEYEPTPEEVAEWRFRQRLDSTKALRHAISQIYRVKVGSKEYLMYNEIMIAEDRMGNSSTHAHLVGRYQHPQFNKEFNKETAQPEASSLLGTKTVYEIPFTKQKVQEILDMDTEDSDPHLVIASGRVKYSGGFSIMDFMNRSFDELMVKGQTGVYPPPNVSADSGAKVREIKKGLVKVEESNGNEQQQQSTTVG